MLVGPREIADLPAPCADLVQPFRWVEALWVAEGDTDAQPKTIVLELESIGRQTCRHHIVRHFEYKARVALAPLLDRRGGQSHACEKPFNLRRRGLVCLSRFGEIDGHLRRKFIGAKYQAMLQP